MIFNSKLLNSFDEIAVVFNAIFSEKMDHEGCSNVCENDSYDSSMNKQCSFLFKITNNGKNINYALMFLIIYT